MAVQGSPVENGYAEWLMRTIKEEEIDLSEYTSFLNALERIGHFIKEAYQKKRTHFALGYLAPAPVEFKMAWWKRQEKATSLKLVGKNLASGVEKCIIRMTGYYIAY